MPENSVKRKRKSWKERMEKIEKSWYQEKDKVMAAIKSSLVMTEKCQQCVLKPACLNCKECRIELCETCDQENHIKRPLHNRICLVNGVNKPLSPMQALNENFEIYTVGRFIYIM